MRSDRIGEYESLWLDFFRGLAAFEVLSGHLFAMVFGQTPRPPGLVGYITGAIGVLSSKPHQAVIIFFALSGYLVGGPFLMKAMQGKASPRSYIIARTTRLYIVVIPALVLTAALNPPQAFIEARHFFFPDGTSFSAACNLAFMQTLYCMPYGVNGSLWSLSNEAFYYALWLCLVMRWWPAAACVFAVIVLGPMTGPIGYFSFFGIWIAGALSFVVGKRAQWLLLLSPLMLARSLIIADIGLAAAFLALLVSLRAVRFPLPQRPFRGLAQMSFSLYAIHLPVGIFILVCLGAISPVARDLHGLGVFAFTIVSTIAVAVLFYLAFERHTPKIRKRLSAYCERFRGQAFRPA